MGSAAVFSTPRARVLKASLNPSHSLFEQQASSAGACVRGVGARAWATGAKHAGGTRRRSGVGGADKKKTAAALVSERVARPSKHACARPRRAKATVAATHAPASRLGAYVRGLGAEHARETENRRVRGGRERAAASPFSSFQPSPLQAAAAGSATPTLSYRTRHAKSTLAHSPSLPGSLPGGSGREPPSLCPLNPPPPCARLLFLALFPARGCRTRTLPLTHPWSAGRETEIESRIMPG